jgi:predicted nucleic acid-binding protein
MRNERPTTASTMSRLDLFVDSSALFAGVASSTGAARALVLLAEADQITITVSEQVVAETERALARKLPQALGYYREALRSTGLRIVHDPSAEEVEAHQAIVSHRADVPIVVAAMKADVDYLATFNRRHFIDDPEVTARAGIPIGTPGDALAWVRGQLAQEAK